MKISFGECMFKSDGITTFKLMILIMVGVQYVFTVSSLAYLMVQREL